MPIVDATRRNEYTGSGSTGPFTYNFRILDETHIEVLLVTIATGAVELLVIDDDYTVAGVGDATGSITLVATLESTHRLVLLGRQPLAQASSYTSESFPPGRMTQDFDKVFIALQQLYEQGLRSLKLRKQSTMENIDVEDPVDEAFLYYDATAGRIRFGTPAATDLVLPVSIANGGTGATNAATARANLGVQNLTTPVPIADGGTNATTASGARASLGAASTAHVASHASGGSDPLTAVLIESIVKRIRQTGSPSAGATTDLLIGAIADGHFLKRSGTGVIGEAVTIPAQTVQILDRDVTAAQVANTTTETAIYSFIVPANTLSTNKMLRVTALGRIQQSSGGSIDITARLKYGTATITAGAVGVANGQDTLFRFQGYVAAKNSTSAQFLGLVHTYSQGLERYGRGTATENSATDLTLTVTLAWASASANAQIDIDDVFLELVG